MSRLQFRCTILILRHAWLNLWDKHMTTGRINQVAAELYFDETERSANTGDSESRNCVWPAYVGWIFECVLAWVSHLSVLSRIAPASASATIWCSVVRTPPTASFVAPASLIGYFEFSKRPGFSVRPTCDGRRLGPELSVRKVCFESYRIQRFGRFENHHWFIRPQQVLRRCMKQSAVLCMLLLMRAARARKVKPMLHNPEARWPSQQ